jgi:undecaprenyl-diphosphatase
MTSLAAGSVGVEVARGFTDFGGPVHLVRVLLLATAYLLIRRRPRLVGFVAVTAAGALLYPLSGLDLPSGFAVASVVGYGVLLLVFLPAVAPPWRTPTAVVAASLVIAVDLLRALLDGHTLAGTVTGWLLGVSWLAVTAAAYRRLVGADLLVPFGAGCRTGRVDESLRAAPDEPAVLDRPWRTTAKLLAAWTATLTLLVGFGTLITGALAGSALVVADQAAVDWMVAYRSAVLDPVAAFANRIGDTNWTTAGAVAAGVVILAVRRRLRPALFLAVVMLGEITLFLTTTALVDRDRPVAPHLGEEVPPTDSFPSGHVAAPLCLWLAVALLLWHWSPGWQRWLAVTAAVTVPTGVAFARLYSGVHHPLDLLGSLLLAVPWVAACWWAVRPVDEASMSSGERRGSAEVAGDDVGGSDPDRVGVGPAPVGVGSVGQQGEDEVAVRVDHQ